MTRLGTAVATVAVAACSLAGCSSSSSPTPVTVSAVPLPTGSPSPPTLTPPATTAPPQGDPDAGAVGNSAWLAWSRGDLTAVGTLATPQVVEALRARPFRDTDAWRTVACGGAQTPLLCRWQGAGMTLEMRVDLVDGRPRVVAVSFG